MQPAHLVLEDGTVFPGRSVGASGVAAGEACFTTAMAGYEEAASDPSYMAQVLAFSYPLIGNYGVDPGRLESDGVCAEGIVMRKSRPGWAQWLAAQGVVALDDVDTRALVRKIRDGGVLRCALGEAPVEELHARALAEPPIDGRPLGRPVGTRQPYRLGAGPRITVLDLGTKRSIPARLAACGLEVLVVPGDWDADAITETDPRAVLVSNGPGDPAVLAGPIETVRGLLGQLPLFGICLGHQVLGLALGLETFKLPFGHRGANHPVRDLTKKDRVLVTVQNHGFAVADSGDVEVTHVSLNDGTVEGFAGDGFASLQFHPEAAPGPLDALPFFDLIAGTCRSAPTFALSWSSAPARSGSGRGASSTTRERRRAVCCDARAIASCSSTPTRRRS
jgi:carbamoyl-phosphate synthase small subunit